MSGEDRTVASLLKCIEDLTAAARKAEEERDGAVCDWLAARRAADDLRTECWKWANGEYTLEPKRGKRR